MNIYYLSSKMVAKKALLTYLHAETLSYMHASTCTHTMAVLRRWQVVVNDVS